MQFEEITVETELQIENASDNVETTATHEPEEEETDEDESEEEEPSEENSEEA